jgi:hypothetical protein
MLTCCYIWLPLRQLSTSHSRNTLPEAAIQLAAIVPQQFADIVAVARFPLNLHKDNSIPFARVQLLCLLAVSYLAYARG